MKKFFVLAAVLTVMVGAAVAQIMKPVKWEITLKKVSEGVYDVVCKATIDKGWHLYDTKLPEGGPLPTTFNVDDEESSNVELDGEFKATTEAMTKQSEAFNMEMKYFENTVTFVQRLKVKVVFGKKIKIVTHICLELDYCINVKT